MWADVDEMSGDWMGPWRALFRCSKCGAFIKETPCQFCNWIFVPGTKTVIKPNGEPMQVCMTTTQGAIEWTSHMLLGMMQREWERPLHSDHWINQHKDGPSQRATIALLFWTHFEFLMERFFDAAMSRYPDRVRDDLLRRYGQIGARLDRLYRVVFDTTFWADLSAQGDDEILAHLREIQEARNAFVHGNPEVLDDTLVRKTVELLPAVQTAWIRLYNRRCIALPDATD